MKVDIYEETFKYLISISGSKIIDSWFVVTFILITGLAIFFNNSYSSFFINGIKNRMKWVSWITIVNNNLTNLFKYDS